MAIGTSPGGGPVSMTRCGALFAGSAAGRATRTGVPVAGVPASDESAGIMRWTGRLTGEVAEVGRVAFAGRGADFFSCNAAEGS